jgi:DNA-binding NarL/FixJ family response regulator
MHTTSNTRFVAAISNLNRECSCQRSRRATESQLVQVAVKSCLIQMQKPVSPEAYMTLAAASFARDTLNTFSTANQQTSLLACKNMVLDQIPGAALEQLERHPYPKACVVLTDNPCPDYLTDLLAHQPAALLANGEQRKDVFQALEVVANGGRVTRLPNMVPSPLTPCERTVLRQIARAQCDKRIAKKLGISDGTVRKRVSEILAKLGLENRMQLGYYYLGLWSHLDAYREHVPIHTREQMWGLRSTDVHSDVGIKTSTLKAFELAVAFGHTRAPEEGLSIGGFMIREITQQESLEVVGGWVPGYRNPELRDVTPAKPRIPVFDVNPPRTSPVVPWWKMPMV